MSDQICTCGKSNPCVVHGFAAECHDCGLRVMLPGGIVYCDECMTSLRGAMQGSVEGQIALRAELAALKQENERLQSTLDASDNYAAYCRMKEELAALKQENERLAREFLAEKSERRFRQVQQDNLAKEVEAWQKAAGCKTPAEAAELIAALKRGAM